MGERANISFKSIVLSIAFLLLISSPYIAQRTNNIIKLCLEILLIVILLSTRKINKNAIKACIPAFIFMLVSLYSTFRWSGLSSRLMNAGTTSFAYVLLFYLIVLYCKDNNRIVRKTIERNLIFYNVILDFFVLLTNGKGLGGLPEAVYLLGNKFMVSYFHMALLALFISNSKKRNINFYIKIILYALYSIVILRIADTMTGVIGIVFMILGILILNKRREIFKVLTNPAIVIVFFIGINAIFLFSNILLNNEFIMKFLMKYSHTDTLLSGRLPMYKLTIESISNNYIWGYGINYDIVLSTFGFGNPQNGLLKMMLDFGVVGTISFLWMMYSSFRNSKLIESSISEGVILFIYSMLFCSLVEINIDILFYLFLTILSGLSNCYTSSSTKKS